MKAHMFIYHSNPPKHKRINKEGEEEEYTPVQRIGVIAFDIDGEKINAAGSLCSKNDMFIAKTGKIKAYNRLTGKQKKHTFDNKEALFGTDFSGLLDVLKLSKHTEPMDSRIDYESHTKRVHNMIQKMFEAKVS